MCDAEHFAAHAIQDGNLEICVCVCVCVCLVCLFVSVSDILCPSPSGSNDTEPFAAHAIQGRNFSVGRRCKLSHDEGLCWRWIHNSHYILLPKRMAYFLHGPEVRMSPKVSLSLFLSSAVAQRSLGHVFLRSLEEHALGNDVWKNQHTCDMHVQKAMDHTLLLREWV